MKKSAIYGIWAGLYCLCAGLGFVHGAGGLGKFLLVLTCLLFFVPPFYLIFLAKKENSRKTLSVLRLVSISSLSVTLLLLVLNFMSVNFSAQAGLWLYVLLVMFSAPMMCGQYWVLSLFLWACVLFATFLKDRPYQR